MVNELRLATGEGLMPFKVIEHRHPEQVITKFKVALNTPSTAERKRDVEINLSFAEQNKGAGQQDG